MRRRSAEGWFRIGGADVKSVDQLDKRRNTFAATRDTFSSTGKDAT
ncbi:MAG TPA: hypothetical protein VM529_00755 [Gemmata sp.]|nr:hypothetical protein [Gemmata sp.]